MSNSDSPKVSVVSITYNHARYIAQALDSFLDQKTDFDFEVIVADDASTDETTSIIQEYVDKHPDIFKPILRQKNVGIQPNCIDAFQKAKGDYVAFCEGDDYWTDSTKLQKQVEFLNSHKDYALCFHPVKIAFEGDSQKNYVYPEDGNRGFSVAKLLEGNFIQSNSVLYRRQSYDDLPADVMPLDWYLHLYHAQFGKIGFIDETMSVYRRHPGGVWWDAAKDSDKIWDKFGLAHMALYNEFLKLFGSKSEYKNIIAGLVINGFNALERVNYQLFLDVSAKFSDCADIYIQNLREQIDKLNAHAKEQAKIIEHYQNELEQTKNETQSLRHALNKSPTYKLKQIVKRRKKLD